MHVQRWNERAHDLWGVREEEVLGRSFLTLDIGLKVDTLRGELKACLEGKRNRASMSMTATDRRGKSIECSVTCTPLVGSEGDIDGVVLLMFEGNEAERGKRA
jgi:two-component system CheB/CheR fusion protein